MQKTVPEWGGLRHSTKALCATGRLVTDDLGKLEKTEGALFLKVLNLVCAEMLLKLHLHQ